MIRDVRCAVRTLSKGKRTREFALWRYRDGPADFCCFVPAAGSGGILGHLHPGPKGRGGGSDHGVEIRIGEI